MIPLSELARSIKIRLAGSSVIYLGVFLLLAGKSFAAEQASVDASIDRLNQLAGYRQTIADLESSTGPYSFVLFEPLTSFAQALVEAGIYTEGLEVINRGAQISRINEGFYNLLQLPLLQLALEINVELADFEAANDMGDYLVDLYSNAYSDEPLTLLQSLESMSDWHLSVLSRDEEKNRASHLLQSYDISLQMVEIAAQQVPQDLSLLNYYRFREALSVHYFTSAMAVGGMTGARVLTETGTLGLIRQTENTARFRPREFEEKLNRSLAMLKQIMDSYGDETAPLTEAKVMSSIYYADWLILYRDGMRVIGESSPLNTPRRLYRQAREDLISLGYEADTVDRYFRTPALLPMIEYTESFATALELAQGVKTTALQSTDPDMNEENIRLPRLPDFVAWSESLSGVTMPANEESNLAAELAELHGDVRFRVDTSGKASRLSVIQHYPVNKQQRVELLREVQSLVFRPAMINGRFRNSEMMTMRYYYPLDYKYRNNLGLTD